MCTARILPVVALLLVACATGRTSPASDEPTEQDVLVEVRNDLTPRTSVTIRIVSASGTRSVLGTVSPGRTTTLRFREPYFEATYRLVADPVDAEDIRSRTFELFPNSTVEWRLSNNTLRFAERQQEARRS